MTDRKTRIEILAMVQRGEITPPEGLRLIRAVEGSLEGPAQPAGQVVIAQEAFSASAMPVPAEADGSEDHSTEWIPVVAPDATPAMAASAGGAEEQAQTEAEISQASELPVAELLEVEPNLPGAGGTPVPEPPGQPEPSVSLPAVVALKPDSGHETAREDEIQDRIRRLKQWGMIPFWIGMGLMILSAFWMFLGYQAAGLSWGFWSSWFPFSLGVLLMVGGWWSQTARWLHVRVQQKGGQRPGLIGVSFPLPLKLAAWAMHTFGRYIPKGQGANIDEFIRMADENLGVDSPFYVEVNDGDEQVEVYIG